MTVVLDYVTQPAPSAQMRAAGVGGVAVYIAPARWKWPKAITLAQVLAHAQARMPILFNYETTISDWSGGHSAGLVAGANIGEAMNDLTMAATQCVCVSYDQEINADHFPIVADYHRGVIEKNRGRLFPLYGEGDLIEYLVAQGLAPFGWLSESQSFPGSRKPTPHTALWQHYGQTMPGVPGSYDVNTVEAPYWGQWTGGTATPAPSEDDMLVLFPNVPSTVPGREATLAYDPTNRQLVGVNGVHFDPHADAHVWEVHKYAANQWNLTGTAKLLLPIAPGGDVRFGMSHDGLRAILFASGDGGTFAIAMSGAVPMGAKGDKGDKGDPGPASGTVLDIHSIAAEVVQHLAVTVGTK